MTTHKEKERGIHCWGCDCDLCKEARVIEKVIAALKTMRDLRAYLSKVQS